KSKHMFVLLRSHATSGPTLTLPPNGGGKYQASGDGDAMVLQRRPVLRAAEERNDVAIAPAAPVARRQHQGLLGLEEDVGRSIDRPDDPKPLAVAAIALGEQLDAAPPGVGRD